MSIKLTNREMLDIINSDFFNLKEIPAKLCFTLALMKNKLKDPLRAYDQARLNIGQRFCDKDENGAPKVSRDGAYIITDQNREKANREIGELMDVEVEIPGDKIEFPLSRLVEYGIEISTNEMLVLLPVINFRDDLEYGAKEGESSNKVIDIKEGGNQE